MTISPYQVNSILKAYSKQSKVKLQISGNEHLKNDKYMDVVSLSSENDKTISFNKLSYSLRDIIIKEK